MFIHNVLSRGSRSSTRAAGSDQAVLEATLSGAAPADG